MSKESGLTMDTEEVLNLFKRMSYKEQKKVYRQALRKSSNIIKRETTRNLKKNLGAAATRIGKYKAMTKGIKVKVAKDALSAKVHLMGDFRLKWFEMGTQDRILKKRKKRNGSSWSTGKIRGMRFFANATQAKQQEANDCIVKNLEESILKAYRKK